MYKVLILTNILNKINNKVYTLTKRKIAYINKNKDKITKSNKYINIYIYIYN